MKGAPSISTYGGVFLARCGALVGPLGTAVITARMLGPEDRGRYYYVITLATIGAQVASLGIHSSNTFVVSKQPDLLPRVLVNTAWIAIAGGIASAIGVIIFDHFLGDAMQLRASAGLVFVLCPLTLLFIYLSNLAVAVNRSRLFNGLIILNSVASLGTTLAAAVWAPTLHMFLVAIVATGLLSCTVAWLLVAQGSALSWRFDGTLFMQSIAFALRAHVIILLGFLMARTSPVILRNAEAFADLGHWSIAAQIADALLLLPATVSLLLYPALVRADDESRWTELKRIALRLGLMMAALCFIFALLAAPAIELVFGAAYAPAVGITLALLPGVFVLSVVSVISQFLTAIGIPKVQIAGWLVGLCVQVVLSIVVFKSYGVVGLAWVQSACAGVVLIWLSILVLGYSPKRFQPL